MNLLLNVIFLIAEREIEKSFGQNFSLIDSLKNLKFVSFPLLTDLSYSNSVKSFYNFREIQEKYNHVKFRFFIYQSIKKYESPKLAGYYEGEFSVDNFFEGKGREVYYQGQVYEGEFKKGEREGKGKYYYPNGNRYEGEFKEGVGGGKGVLFFFNGSRLEGEFKNGEVWGKANFYSMNGSHYIGEFKNFKKHCDHGIEILKNGEKFEGKFRNDKRNGKGVLTSADGIQKNVQYKYNGEYTIIEKK